LATLSMPHAEAGPHVARGDERDDVAVRGEKACLVAIKLGVLEDLLQIVLGDVREGVDAGHFREGGPGAGVVVGDDDLALVLGLQQIRVRGRPAGILEGS
jgi:hypothetical protein